MADRVTIDVDISVQEMVGLRIVGGAQDFFDENLAETSCRERSQQNAQSER